MQTIDLGSTQFDGRVSLRLDKANRHGLVTGATGTGKCWGKGTGLIMFDGTVKAVEDIKTGDLMMGPDSTPRRVLSTTRGVGPLYRIIPVKGDPWVCNDVHILSLRRTATIKKKLKGEIVNVPLNEYLGWSKTRKHLFKLWRAPVDFEPQKCPADPYMTGLYLADGSYPNSSFNHDVADIEKYDQIESHFGASALKIREGRGSREIRISREHEFWKAIKSSVKSRTIPHWIRANSVAVRQEFLAGFIDGDGSESGNGFDIVTKHKGFSDGIAFIARSLGLAATVKSTTKTIKSVGFAGDYFRVHISGDTETIPVRCKRKKCGPRRQKKNVLNTGFSVEDIGDGEYFGFELDGDRLCLLWDFTVTHNTVTLQRLAEQFSAAGVPVFAADIKGDLSGVAAMGDPNGPAPKRADLLGIDWKPDQFPVALWDLWGQHGAPIRTSVQAMGKQMISAMLSLTPVQDGTLEIAFRKAEDDQDYMLTLDDLRWSLNDMAEERETICKQYGNVTAASIAAIQRGILAIENQGGAQMFGEPPFDVADLMRHADDGRGVINLLNADRLVEQPKLYAMFLLWLLSALYKSLPEAGDIDKPKLVFFFDEAHLLFKDAPKALLQTIEQMVRLVRSKGVGVFFVTQSPQDVPDSVLAQLGNRVQHALRAYTPKDRRMVKAAADAFRPNPDIDIKGDITNLGVGEAFVSVLDDDGVPTITQKIKIMPPAAQIGPISEIERDTLRSTCPMAKRYQHAPDEATQAYKFVRRMKEQRGIDTGPDNGPVEYDAGSFEQFVPYHIGAEQEDTASPWRHAASIVGWGIAAVIFGSIALASI